MEFDILYAIQNLHSPLSDRFILGLTTLMGDYGTFWLAVAVLLLIFRKTRKTGIAILISYGLVYIAGQLILKDWIARPRPCHLDETVTLLISRPSSFSCPSTHSAWAFGAAVPILYGFRKWGIAALLVATLVGFSRMYLFVHFPTDVLLGVGLGILSAIVAVKIVGFLDRRIHAKA